MLSSNSNKQISAKAVKRDFATEVAGPLRVLVVTTNMNRGGLETFTMNVYRALDRSKVQLDFLLHRPTRSAYDDEIEALGGRIYRIRRQNPLDLRYWAVLDEFFAEHSYKAVWVQLDCMSAEPLAAAARHGAVVRVAHSHSSRQDKDLKYPLKMLCKPFIKRYATDLFACGEEAGRWMFGTDDFKVVRNCIDVDAYAFDPAVRTDVRRELGIAEGAPVMGHVGRFDAVKNHAFLLDAFAELLKRQPRVVLLLAGDGPLRSEMETKAGELGIAESVMFLGVRSDVPRLMQAMDCFVMPSLYEGLPMVLVEAQAAGLPCLISDLIPHDCDIEGGSVDRENLRIGAVTWASRIESILAVERNRAMGAGAVRAAKFDSKETAAWLQDFYLSASSGVCNG